MIKDFSKIDEIKDFVILSDVVPDIIQEIRYYSTYNFVGERINGYDEPYAILTKKAANALKKVSDNLNLKGYRLKIYDAYRPQMAVNHFINWINDSKNNSMKEYFYKNISKSELLKLGYIKEKSSHSRGSTVDLTLVDMKTGLEIDMGSSFDCFDNISNYKTENLTRTQYKNRMILKDAMINEGFKPIAEEWWHFTLEDEPYPNTYFNFPVNSNLVR